jgi:hypothetical protein
MSNKRHNVGVFTFYPEQSPSYFTGMVTWQRLMQHLAERATEISQPTVVRVFSGDGEEVARVDFDDGANPRFVPVSLARQTMTTELLYRDISNKWDVFKKMVAERRRLIAKYR